MGGISDTNMMRRTLTALGVAAIVGAIASPNGARAQFLQHLPPAQFEDHVVTAAQGTTGTLTFNEPEVWLDSDGVRPATKGIRLPSGTHELEAEDTDYLYYRAPERFEWRLLENDQVKKAGFEQGGIYVSKSLIALVPAGIYMSLDEKKKTLIWKLGSDFMRLGGSKWTRTKIVRAESGK